MIPSDQRPAGDDWLMRRLAELETKIREVQAGRRLEAATIGSGGIRIKGGTVVVVDDNGNEIVRIGKVPGFFGDVPGLTATRTPSAGGGTAMSLSDGIFAVWDRNQNVVLSTDELSGQGLATPYLPVAHFGISFNSATYSQIPGVTSSTFTPILETRTPLTHPRLRINAFVGTDVAGTVVEGRITLDGAVIATSSGGTISTTVSIPGWGSTVAYLQEANIQLEVRRVSGTGRAMGQVYALYGVQS